MSDGTKVKAELGYVIFLIVDNYIFYSVRWRLSDS